MQPAWATVQFKNPTSTSVWCLVVLLIESQMIDYRISRIDSIEKNLLSSLVNLTLWLDGCQEIQPAWATANEIFENHRGYQIVKCELKKPTPNSI